ncbi:hypothetical protein RO07_21005 [Pandoraea pulmonicola]|uniref:Uncharacterized protein n=1 Tax=Pandoraea pulmonicola TaxID=93221 RepID=A0ABM6FSD0_PANPU|nr:hypothetical protein RO07_21005 [Pandoraea pulmonicola]
MPALRKPHILITLLAPQVPVAQAYGGIGWSAVANPDSVVLVRIAPNLEWVTGDIITLYWGDASRAVDVHPLKEEELGLPIVMRATVQDVVRVGDGTKSVWYTFKGFGPDAVESPKLDVLVKTTVPGGLDPDPVNTPYENENLAAPTPSVSVIDSTQAQAGITVTVPAWKYMAVGDKLRVRWGTQSVYAAPVLLADVGSPVVVPIDAQTIAAAGDSDKLMVTYDITDAVDNWSNNSMPAYVNVEASGTQYLPPDIPDAVNGVLDVDALGTRDEPAIIVVEAPMTAGDVIHLVFEGVSSDGQQVTEESASPPIRTGARTVYMSISNDVLHRVVPGVASVYFRVTDSLGGDKGRSQRAYLTITGTALQLAAPTVLEAVGGNLDPANTANGAHVQIPPWPAMAVGDVVVLDWNGTTANGRPLAYPDQTQIAPGAEGSPVVFVVPSDFVTLLAGGKVDVSYKVRQGAVEQQSQHLLLNVVGALTLPRPGVQGVSGGVLDPAAVPTGVQLTIDPWTPMAVGDRVDWYWRGQSAAGSTSGSVTVTAAMVGQPIQPTVPRTVIDADAANNEFVTVSYTVTRVDGSAPQDSAWTQFSVVSPQGGNLPAPSVDQAVNGILDPATLPAAGATVRVKPYPGMQDGDSVTVQFAPGTGAGAVVQEFDVSTNVVGNDITMLVPKDKVSFHLNSQVVVNYIVKRYATGKLDNSDDLVLSVQTQQNWPAPGVDEAQGDYLDPANIAGGVTTRVYANSNMQRGDQIEMSWGKPGDTGYYDDSIAVSTPRDYRFLMDAAEVQPWVGRIADISYQVTRGGGAVPAKVFQSDVLHLRVGGTQPNALPAPTILEAQNGVLDPDVITANATAQIPAYSGMASGDAIHLIWGGGPGSGGLEWYINVSDSMVGKPINRDIPKANILPFLNRTASLLYTVDNGSSAVRTSDPYQVQIERQAEELDLPQVLALNKGVLDPRDVPDGANVVIPFHTGMRQGDIARLHWDSSLPAAAASTQIDSIVGSSTSNIELIVPSNVVYAGINGNVDAWYEWMRGGNRLGASPTLAFAIKLSALPPATIDQAKGTNLNPDDVPPSPSGATVRFASSAMFALNDQIELHWTGAPGPGSGTFPYTVQAGDVGNDVTIVVDKSYVDANNGGSITLDYKVTRAQGGMVEQSAPSIYDVQRQLGSGNLLVMGARAHGGIYRASSTPRYLRAIDKSARKDLYAEWRYEDDANWVSGVSFKDTRPWVPLKVRSANDQVGINPINIAGSGSDATNQTGVSALVALLGSDNVIGWGVAGYGGAVPPTIITFTDVIEISSTQAAFTVRRANGRVAVWGDTSLGGAIPGGTNITNAQRIFGNAGAFVTIQNNGALTAWGRADYGGTLSADAQALIDVQTVASAGMAFCALRNNGQVIAWGVQGYGGSVPGNIAGATDIVSVLGNFTAFCALRGNGTVVAWGASADGGVVPQNVAARRDLLELASATARAFAVRTTGGEVLAWGNANYGGTLPSDIATLNDVEEVTATWGAFCARRANGTVVAWGDPARGGSVPTAIAGLTDIVQVTGNSSAFAALRRNGSVVAWGAAATGGTAPATVTQAQDIRAVYGNTEVFVALKDGGGVVTWGVAVSGGDSSSVKSLLDSQLFYQARPMPTSTAESGAVDAVPVQT